MQTSILSSLFGLAAVAVLGVAGCASSDSAASGKEHAISCPKCETTWVSQQESYGTKINRVTKTKKMVCPDCEAMAESVLREDGKVQLHRCPTCLVTPERVAVP